MALTAIGELIEPVMSWSPERDNPAGTFSYIDLSAVDQENKVVVAVRELACTGAPSRARQKVRAGDVLVSTVRPNLNGVAQVPPELDGATASTGFCVLRASPRALDPRYLYQWVKSPRFVSDMTRKATGASYPAVSDRIVAESTIPLLSLPEQRRIAAILDKADALRAKRRAAIAKLDELTQSIFLDMFGDPVANPKSWPMHKLGSVLAFQQYGPRFYNEAYSADGIRIVRITDLDASGALRFTDMPRMIVSAEDQAKYSLHAGDVIFARTGATVGKVALIGPYDPPCIAGAYFIVMRFKPEHVAPEYALAVLMARSIRAIVTRRSRQAAQQNFSGPGLRALPMPLAPVELQREFIKRIAAAESIKASHRAASKKLSALFASLQQRVFREGI